MYVCLFYIVYTCNHVSGIFLICICVLARVLSRRLVEISASSKCALQALPVQLPLHTYEDEVYALCEAGMPAPPPSWADNQSQLGSPVKGLRDL